MKNQPEDTQDTIWPDSSQERRTAPELLPDSVLVDNRTIEILLGQVASLSKEIKYYTAYNNKLVQQGSWDFLQNSSIFILAQIATYSVGMQREYFTSLIKKLEDKKKTTDRLIIIREAFEAIKGIVDNIKDWTERSKKSTLEPVFQAELATTLRQLPTNEVDKLAGEVDELAEKVNSLIRSILGPMANLSKVEIDQDNINGINRLGVELRQLYDSDPRLSYTHNSLAILLWQFHNATQYLQDLASRTLTKELQSESTHAPETGLLLTFLKLFNYAQNEINTFPARHLDYYYRIYLGLYPRKATLDTGWAGFQITPKAEGTVLPVGTQVQGIDPAGNPVVFQTTEKTTLSTSQISRVHNLFVAHSSDKPKAAVNGIYAISDETPERPLVNLPVFGEDQLFISSTRRTMQGAVIGFALTSPVLRMRAGFRLITLELKIAPESFKELVEIGEHLQKQFRSRSWKGVLSRFIRNTFLVSVTGSQGWITISTLKLVIDSQTSTLTFSFLIDKSIGPVIDYNLALHGGRYKTPAPVLRFLLNPQANLYGYSLFAALRPERIHITASVKHIQPEQISSQVGPLDTKAIFYPFGIMPRPGAVIKISDSDWERKIITRLAVELRWFGLPREPDGFADYYKAYDADITNDSFQVQLGVATDGTPTFQPSLAPLFTTSTTPNHATTLAETSTFSIKLPTFQGIFDEMVIELASPATGFGDQLYQDKLREITTYNSLNKQKKALPKPPYYPQANRLLLSYDAVDEIDFDWNNQQLFFNEHQIFHLTPFAEFDPFTLPAELFQPRQTLPIAGKRFLVPLMADFSAQGYLYLGITPSSFFDSFSVYFAVKPPYRSAYSQPDLPPVTWAVLDNDAWQPLVAGDDYADETMGFKTSGRVIFSLKKIPEVNHRTMPANLYWLRASVQNGAMYFGNVSGLYPQLIPLKQMPAVEPISAIPSGTLNQLVSALPGVLGVYQPMPSPGGLPVEDQLNYTTRISERLRHRNRAITRWDYERLLLDQFPQIHKVRCLSPDELTEAARREGQIVIMVLPRCSPTQIPPFDETPLVDRGKLSEMAAWLQSLSYASVNVKVINPLYERIRVRCHVTVIAGPEKPDLRILKQDLNNYLSPWIEDSDDNNFQITPSLSAIQAFILGLPYIDTVTALSVVKTTVVDERYLLYDTAGKHGEEKYSVNSTDMIKRKEPWTVFIPATIHDINQEVNSPGNREPTPFGIGNLQIESDFTVSNPYTDNN